MADRYSKTEKPTQKKIKDSRRKGQIARTPELGAWGSLLVAVSVVPFVIRLGNQRMEDLFDEVQTAAARPSPEAAVELLREGIFTGALIVAPLAAVMVVLAVGFGVAQVGLSAELVRLKPQVGKLNPLKGLKRMFSANTVWEAGKQAIKVAILAGMASRALMAAARRVADAGGLSVPSVVGILSDEVVKLVRGVVMLGLVLALLDYLWQRRKIGRDLMMTKQEVRDEHRQQEGDPHMRGAVRSRQMAMSRNRMIRDVSGADAVVVNPTHLAIALTYDPERGAPRVVAKGAGHVAMRIREEAQAHHVPVVHDVPLARTLFQACEVGHEIPADLYDAVARLLAFIFTMRTKGLASGYHDMRQSLLGDTPPAAAPAPA